MIVEVRQFRYITGATGSGRQPTKRFRIVSRNRDSDGKDDGDVSDEEMEMGVLSVPKEGVLVTTTRCTSD